MRGKTLAFFSVTTVLTFAAQAQTTETILHAFLGTDGSAPASGLLEVGKDDFYGTTLGGGIYGYGTAYRLRRRHNGTWAETVIHDFKGTDGAQPIANLILDKQGNLYGTTEFGSSDNCEEGCGSVFQLIPGSGGSWTENQLYAFQGGADGANPRGSLLLDAAGNIYGTTYAGGAYGYGNVFRLKPGSGVWTESVLYSFSGGSDGGNPAAALIFDDEGNLYGTTSHGGDTYGDGLVFRLTRSENGWKETVLHLFNAGDDGAIPISPPIFDAARNLWGTTAGGGYGWGTVFELTRISDDDWAETFLHPFEAGNDGYSPDAGLTADSAGNFYGTTQLGGVYGWGDVFEVSPNSGGATVSIFYSFNGKEGYEPIGGVTLDARGDVYGTTIQGGITTEGGVVYELRPD